MGYKYKSACITTKHPNPTWWHRITIFHLQVPDVDEDHLIIQYNPNGSEHMIQMTPLKVGHLNVTPKITSSTSSPSRLR